MSVAEAREVDIVRPRQHLPWFRAGSTSAQAAPSERGNHFLRPVACTITGRRGEGKRGASCYRLCIMSSPSGRCP